MSDPAFEDQTADPPIDEPPVERPHPLTALAQAWILFVAAAWGLAQEFLTGDADGVFGWQMWVLIALSAIQLVQGVAQAWFTKFVATDSQFLIETKFVWRSSKRITFGKIQSIDVTQPFAARLMGLARLTVEVGASNNYTIEFLSRRRAEELRLYLLERAHESQVASRPAPELTTTASEDAEQVELAASPATPEPEQVIRIPGQRLLVATTSNLSFAILVVASLVSLVFVVLGQPLTLFFVWFLPLGAMFYSQVVQNWNFTLSTTQQGLRVTRGATSLSSRNIPLHRVQGVVVSQGLLWRALGLYEVRLTVLGGALNADADSGTSANLMPAGTWEEARRVVAAVWPEIDLDALEWVGQPRAAKWLTPLNFKFRAWSQNLDVLASRRGALGRRIDLVPYARMQSMSISKGPLQRKLGLAILEPHITSGPVHVQAGYLPGDYAPVLLQQVAGRARHARTTSAS